MTDVEKKLSKRLGIELYKRRIYLEETRRAEFCNLVSPKFTLVKRTVIRPLQVFALKLTGVYEKGVREFHDIKIVENVIKIKGLPIAFDGFRLMQMSDLHIDIDEKLVDIIKRAAANIVCDICVLTGDYRNLTVGPHHAAVRMMTAITAGIKAPIYAVPGNHDFLNMVPPLEAAGIRFLLNESVVIRRGNANLCLSGIDDPYIYGTHDIPRVAAQAAGADVRVLLAHSPSVFREIASAGFDVMLCGHTHGGQICLPNGHIILKNDPSPRSFWRGAWRYGQLHGYTSSGTGGCGIPIRINCPPEITVHTLRPQPLI